MRGQVGLYWRIVFNNYAIPKVEFINASTKILLVSDANGEFSIIAKTNDMIVFVSKEYQIKKQQLTLNYSQSKN
jgi:hypothetical protein